MIWRPRYLMSNVIKVMVDLQTRRVFCHLAVSNDLSVDDLALRFIEAGLKAESNVPTVTKARAWRRVDRVILELRHCSSSWQFRGRVRNSRRKTTWQGLGFSNVRNLNKTMSNHPYADLYAEQGSAKYFIRRCEGKNKYEADGLKENSAYKISPKQRLQAKALEGKGIPAVIAVAFDVKRATYSCYFALLNELEGRHGIKMTPQALK